MLVDAHSRNGGIRWSRAAVILATLLLALLALYVLLPPSSAAAHGTAAHGAATNRLQRDAQHSWQPPNSHQWQPPLRHTQPHAQHTYLALGDSLAFGYSQARFEANLPEENPAAFETGYVNYFGDVLRVFRPNLQIVNDGCPGETTISMIEGPCLYQQRYPLHHPYVGGPTSSQLSDALAYLAAHPGQVNPITIDIGANDALSLIETTCNFNAACIVGGAPSLFAHVSANLGYILGKLRAAAPHAAIIVLGLYNPFGEKLTGADQLTAQLNEAMDKVAEGVNARFADPLPLFNPPGAAEQPTLCLLTNMCTAKPDIHPTDLGYKVLAGVILHQYLLGLPGRHRGLWMHLQMHGGPRR